MSDPLAWLDAIAAEREANGLQRSLIAHGAALPGRLERDGRVVVNFASNDYLGLAADPRVVAAAQEAAARYGWGAGASPLVTGWRTPHDELAQALAEFERVEAVALFPSGFAANAGTVASLVERGDAVYADRLDHACLIAGVRLAGATLRVYPHGNVDRLASILARDRGRFRRTLIATEGAFSMDGDLAPLRDLVELAECHGAMLLVDEAHGTGVLGADGRGAACELGVADRIPIRVGTLSKALGSIGGFVAGSRRLIDHVVNHASTLIYSTALPPAAAAAAHTALQIAQAEPWRRERVRGLATSLRRHLGEAAAHDVRSADGSSPIVPVHVGEARAAVALARSLLERGWLVPAIRPPTVPRGTSRLRISLTAAHDETILPQLARAVIELLRAASSAATPQADRHPQAG